MIARLLLLIEWALSLLWRTIVYLVDEISESIGDSRKWPVVKSLREAYRCMELPLSDRKKTVVLIYYLEGCRECQSQKQYHESQSYFSSNTVSFVLCNEPSEMRAQGIRRVPRSYILRSNEKPIELGASLSDVKRTLSRYLRQTPSASLSTAAVASDASSATEPSDALD